MELDYLFEYTNQWHSLPLVPILNTKYFILLKVRVMTTGKNIQKKGMLTKYTLLTSSPLAHDEKKVSART